MRFNIPYWSCVFMAVVASLLHVTVPAAIFFSAAMIIMKLDYLFGDDDNI